MTRPDSGRAADTGTGAGDHHDFHMPGVGALPVALSDVPDVPTFRVYGANHDALAQSLDEVFAVFDDVEEWLANGPSRLTGLPKIVSTRMPESGR